MGGSSSSRHISVESEDAEGLVFVKGIRLTDRVVDRMREPPPVQRPQSKSSTCPPMAQPLNPQDKTLAPTDVLAPILPNPPSYASALVPPPLQEPISPLVPLVSVSPETPAPPTSTPTVEAVPSVTHTAPESVPAPVASVQEHVAISTLTDSVPPAPPAESLPITASPLTFTEPVVMPLPSEPVPVVLSPSTEAVDCSPLPPTITDNVTSAPPSELIAIPVEAPAMPLTDDVITAPPVEAIPLPTTVEPIDIAVESSAPSTPTLNLDTTIPVEQIELPTTPTSELVAETEMKISPDTQLPALIESVEISTDMPHAFVEPNLKELLPPLPSSALSVPCEFPSLRQIRCPPNEETPAPTPVVKPAVAPVLPPITETAGPLTSPQAAVNEEDLRKQIREELQKFLQEEMKMAEIKLQQQLKKEKAKAEVEAYSKAQQQIQAEVQKMLEKEQLTLQQTLKDVIMHKNIQDEQLASQYYIQKLEEKERDLAKQDRVQSMYMEQIAKLEEKTAQFTRVTAESFKKGLEETHKRFKRYQIKPVCSELQSEILKCYLQNTGQTLTCSSIASKYVKCVNNAKQNGEKKVSTGG
ncbi:coiled-coil-helix-coiled-coil-helix domain containing 3b [Ictalurus furcatus]|uniref:coiled-coil-helix-coiled-coil-helix domain containing 3b n=1 Tax=Ictalurus furcatus TaxID=66913 RepID=UPI0023504E38|nr:coiled-coil-helix-coiled-coil-helix domain containing 3b [Ictalurus furcatus]